MGEPATAAAGVVATRARTAGTEASAETLEVARTKSTRRRRGRTPNGDLLRGKIIDTSCRSDVLRIHTSPGVRRQQTDPSAGLGDSPAGNSPDYPGYGVYTLNLLLP